jgi:hypothetical protein
MTASKFHNKKTVIDGITFDSQAEARYFLQLKTLMRAGEVTKIEPHPKFELLPTYWKCCGEVSTNTASKHICPYCDQKVPAVKAITYSADFRITWVNGTQTIVDVKGVSTETFLLKKRLFEYKFPNLTLIVVGGKK